jgi:hypothetical protein
MVSQKVLKFVKVKLIKEDFDSETNPEFILFFRYTKRFSPQVQHKLIIVLQKYEENPEKIEINREP